ncbi:MAG: phosphopantetheine-binding protein [Noviherbaspirillum sp.]
MAKMEDIMAAVKTAVSRRFALDMQTFDEETRLGDVGVDSLLMMDLLLDLEVELDFRMENLDLPHNPSAREVVAAIMLDLERQSKAEAG